MWFRKLAVKRHAAAQFKLGAMHENGKGVQKSIAKALSWHRMAAAQEVPEAQACVKEIGAMHSPTETASKQCANCGALEGLGGAALKPCEGYKDAICCGKSAKQSTGRHQVGIRAPALAFPV